MYEQITKNKWLSYFLLAGFFIIVFLLGLIFSVILDWGIAGLFFAALISIIMGLVGYYSGDKIVLSMSKAVLANKKEHAFLINAVDGLAIAAGIPAPKIYVINDSAMNAFATGRDPKNASIAVTTGLMEKLNRTELEGVIAHEMSHIKNLDTRLMVIVAVLVGIVALLSDWILRSMFWGRGNREDKSGAMLVFLVIGIVLAILTPIVAQLIKFAISRKREFLADASGAMLTRHPDGLANALAKISKESNQLKSASKATAHLYISNPFKKGVASWFSTHPPIEERIKALKAM